MSASPSPAEVAQLRAFNRFYTRVIGVLDEGLLASPYSLTEARVMFELAQSEAAEVADLRRELALDAGYLSRILARFESDGLVERARSTRDARRQTIRLTARGRQAFAALDARSAAETERLLAPLDVAARGRLLAAQESIRRLLGDAGASGEVALRDLEPGDLGWVVSRHGALYAQEYGWDATFEALVARIVGTFGESHDPVRERGWIAEVDGERAGCVFCVREDDETARLRLLLVEPAARSRGVGGRLVSACLDFARAAGYRRVVLWTNDVLVEARRIYERAGFRLDEHGPHHAFGHDLVEQTWSLDL